MLWRRQGVACVPCPLATKTGQHTSLFRLRAHRRGDDYPPWRTFPGARLRGSACAALVAHVRARRTRSLAAGRRQPKPARDTTYGARAVLWAVERGLRAGFAHGMMRVVGNQRAHCGTFRSGRVNDQRRTHVRPVPSGTRRVPTPIPGCPSIALVAQAVQLALGVVPLGADFLLIQIKNGVVEGLHIGTQTQEGWQPTEKPVGQLHAFVLCSSPPAKTISLRADCNEVGIKLLHTLFGTFRSSDFLGFDAHRGTSVTG